MKSNDTFFVTTPIYYVTAKPHLGSLYSTLIADVLARWYQLKGKETFFLTGTDEHGQKIAQAAAAAHKDPQAFVDSFIPTYKEAWSLYEINYTKFIRTTDSAHKHGVIQAVQQLMEKGDIYKSTYQGWYCTPCETFITEKELQKTTEPLCPTCGRATSCVSEETYFFKLSAYQERLLQFYKQNPEFVMPKERIHEVTSFVSAGLHDLSISRTTISWGIPFPKDPSHVIYVWVDALLNYMTGIGYGSSLEHKTFSHWWPPTVQILGKDIVRFHAVYWPALLMALGLPLPKQLLVHGWIKVDKEKMSKSRGNIVDPIDLFKKYGADPVRYYLLRQMSINQDGEFSVSDLEQRIASDLANDLGNLLQRMSTLASKHTISELKPPASWSQPVLDLQDEGWNLIEEVKVHMKEFNFHLALARIWKFIHQLNSYFHAQEPWRLIKNNPIAAQEVLTATTHGLHHVGILLWPFMPQKMEALLSSIGHPFIKARNYLEELSNAPWRNSFKITVIPPLFEKPEQDPITPAANMQEPMNTHISIDDLVKVELMVGTITACEPIKESEKLLKLYVDFGQVGSRQILSGIAKSYKPEELVNKQALFVVNLKPRMMLGYESQGMLLVASDAQQQVKIMSPEAVVPNGTRVK